MTRKSKGAAQDEPLEVTQDPPTAPARRDENGFELDSWGLPVVGPIRGARLAELGLPDPNIDPDAWPSESATGSAPTGDAADGTQQTENNDG